MNGARAVRVSRPDEPEAAVAAIGERAIINDRLTVQVLQVVAASRDPMGAEAVAAVVFHGDPRTAHEKRATTWRRLRALERRGMVCRLTPRGGYEATPDGRRWIGFPAP